MNSCAATSTFSFLFVLLFVGAISCQHVLLCILELFLCIAGICASWTMVMTFYFLVFAANEDMKNLCYGLGMDQPDGIVRTSLAFYRVCFV